MEPTGGTPSRYTTGGEEYGVISEIPVGITVDWRGMVLVQGRPVSTANRSFIESNNTVVQYGIVLANNNLMSVLAAI